MKHLQPVCASRILPGTGGTNGSLPLKNLQSSGEKILVREFCERGAVMGRPRGQCEHVEEACHQVGGEDWVGGTERLPGGRWTGESIGN